MPNTIYMLEPRVQCENSLERFCGHPGQQYFGNTFHPRSPRNVFPTSHSFSVTFVCTTMRRPLDMSR